MLVFTCLVFLQVIIKKDVFCILQPHFVYKMKLSGFYIWGKQDFGENLFILDFDFDPHLFR